jgi:hypothetical protein
MLCRLEGNAARASAGVTHIKTYTQAQTRSNQEDEAKAYGSQEAQETSAKKKKKKKKNSNAVRQERRGGGGDGRKELSGGGGVAASLCACVCVLGQ